MTHVQALAGQRIRVQPTTCTGHLRPHDTFEDRHLTHDGVVDLVVTVYRCEKCNHRVVVERIYSPDQESVSLAFVVASDYLPIGPRQMLRALAGNFKMEGQP